MAFRSASRRDRSTGLLGPSGCGKSTLMRSIVGVQIVAGGSVAVLGEEAGSAGLRSRVGYVTQAPSVYADLSVEENLRYFAAVVGAGRERIAAAIETVGLGGLESHLVGSLSGGQRSRVSLASALLGEPEVLVLDEPTVGLDPVLRADLWGTFHELARAGTTLLVSSHVMDEASECDELLLMRDGRLLRQTTPAALREETGERGARRGLPRRDREGGRAVSGRATAATALRVLLQIRHDPRTVALLLVVPTVLLVLLYFVFEGEPHVFQQIGAPLCGLFPFIVMFLITSIAMLRERTSGTLERLMSLPIAKADILFGYGIAFGALAAVQTVIVCARRLPRARARGGPRGLAGRAAGDRQRDPRHGPRAVRQRLRDDRVPGGPVHAGGGAAAADPLRPVRLPRRDGAASCTRSPG